MEKNIKRLVWENYRINVEKLDTIPGGFCLDETYLGVADDRQKYVVKYIVYDHSAEQLRSILQFENILYEKYKYPCPKIIATTNGQVFVHDGDRFLFVQTFIDATEPSPEVLDGDQTYLNEMGRLLATWRVCFQDYSSEHRFTFDYCELSEQWWKDQTMNDIDPLLLTSFFECKIYFTSLNGNFQYGLVHNDFHPNNTLRNEHNQIFIVDFVDACQSMCIADLATSLFHLLVDRTSGERRATSFLEGYQQIVQLTSAEKESLQKLTQLKLTMSIMEDLQDSMDKNDPFIQACFSLLEKLRKSSNFINSLLQH